MTPLKKFIIEVADTTENRKIASEVRPVYVNPIEELKHGVLYRFEGVTVTEVTAHEEKKTEPFEEKVAMSIPAFGAIVGRAEALEACFDQRLRVFEDNLPIKVREIRDSGNYTMKKLRRAFRLAFFAPLAAQDKEGR